MIESSRPPDPDLPTLLSLLGGAVDGHVLTTMRTAGLPGLRASHGYLFQLLVQAPSTATELAARLRISQQAASKAVRELLDLGYIEYTEATDRRRRPVRLSATGQRAVALARTIRADLQNRIEQSAGPADLRAAMRVLAATAAALEIDTTIRGRQVPPPTEQS